jgi:tRNA dimethylallyltransferase
MTRVQNKNAGLLHFMSKLRYLELAGPTAVGKTNLAIRIAQELRTEIVGGDAFQLYDGLDILTGKPAHSQLAAVRHHLVGILPLTELCDAHKYSVLAHQAIVTLNRNGITPLVVGGTGFYLQALADGIPQLPAADLTLRTELNGRSTPDLLADLETRDPLASSRIDKQNRRRIIRALEVCILSGRPFSSFLGRTAPDSDIARIALERPRVALAEKIEQRVDEMFERGVVAEVAAVAAIGATASQAIGFQLIRSFLTGALDISACREAIKQQTRNYAKRQMTWFRRRPYQLVSAESSVDLLIGTFRHQLSKSAS